MHGFVSRRAAHFVTTRAFDSINLTDIFRRAAHAASANIYEIKCRAALWVLSKHQAHTSSKSTKVPFKLHENAIAHVEIGIWIWKDHD